MERRNRCYVPGIPELKRQLGAEEVSDSVITADESSFSLVQGGRQ